MKSRKKIIISSMIVIIVLMGLYATYAYITADIIGNETAKKAVFNSQVLKVEYSGGTETLVSEQDIYFIPGSTLTKTFTITNTGNVKAKFSINLSEISNDFDRPEDLTYQITENNVVLSEGTFPQTDTYIVSKDTLEIDESKTYTLTINYLTSEENQIIDQGKVINAKITIDDTVRTIAKLNIYGNSLQDGTPSPTSPIEIESLGDETKNLFNVDDFLETFSQYYTIKPTFETFQNIECLKIYGGIVLDGRNIEYMKGQFKENTQYTFSMNIYDVLSNGYNGISITVYYTDGTSKALWRNSTAYAEKWNNFKFVSEASKTIDHIRFSYGSGSAYSYIYNWQIEEGATATDYEPYGYKIPLNVGGKNLIENVNPESETINGITYTKNSDGSITMDGTSTATSTYPINSTTSYVGMTTKLAANTQYTLSSINLPANVYFQAYGRIDGSIVYKTAYIYAPSVTFTTSEETNWGFYIKVESGVTVDNVTVYPQLELGSEATDYEPFVSLPTTYNIYLDEPLRKVGDCDTCSDYIDFSNGQVIRNIKTITYTGAESSTEWIYNDALLGFYKWIGDSYSEHVVLSTHFKQHTGNLPNQKDNSAKIKWSSLYIGTGNWDSVSSFHQWITDQYSAGSPLIFHYRLATSADPISIDVPEIDLVQRLTNNISVCSSNGVCASKVEVEYSE